MPERRARILSGLPRPVDRTIPWWKRTLTNVYVWLALGLVALYGVAVWRMYATLHPDEVGDDGKMVPGLNNQALWEGAQLAARTAVVYTILFLLLDRFRRQVPWMYVLSWLWGACMATYISLHANTYFGAAMMVRGAGSPASGGRAAVFSAPFVEELCKATIVFLLVVLVRNRVSSILQSVTLAGMSAIGFAFTENIIYYARARVYSSYTQQAGDADAAVHQTFLLRGVFTSFGHMTFTAMTGIGIGIAVRTRSKLVRILAPLTGYVVAATLHMGFNGFAGNMSTKSQELQFFIVGWGLALTLAAFLVGNVFREARRIRFRLTDFERMGWLRPRDPIVYSSLWRRQWLLIVAARRGWRALKATRHVMADMTELAYTRDGVVRGIIDEAGRDREKVLLAEISALRPLALTDTVGLRLDIPWSKALFWRRRGDSYLPQGGWAAPVPVAVPAQQQWPATPPQWPARR